MTILTDEQIRAAIAAGGRAWANAQMNGDTKPREWWEARCVEAAALAKFQMQRMEQRQGVAA